MASKILSPGDMPPWLYSSFGTAVIRDRGREARLAWLRLPSWGYGYSINTDEMLWGQRVLIYHGHRGFRIQWLFHLFDSKISNS